MHMPTATGLETTATAFLAHHLFLYTPSNPVFRSFPYSASTSEELDALYNPTLSKLEKFVQGETEVPQRDGN